MPVLRLKFKDTVVKDYELKAEESLTIGRNSANDVVVENLAVSGHHAKIDGVGERFLLTDLKSKNGTFVNKNAVSTHWLDHGDVITIGKHHLLFGYRKSEQRPTAESAQMNQTMVMDTQMHRDMLSQSAPAEETAKAPPAKVGVLSFLAGGTGDVTIDKKLIKIGKDKDCDVVVGGLMVAKIAATISIRPDGHHLSYVGGMAKPKVNDQAVKTSTLLNEFDVVELGSAKLQFVFQK